MNAIINARNINVSSSEYSSGIIQISSKKFHLPKISIEFQNITTVGIAYLTASAILLILIKRRNKNTDQISDPKNIQ